MLTGGDGMEKAPSSVFAVVDRAFGERLAGIGPDVPVWVVDTPVNRPVAERLWKERPAESHLTGITLFVDSVALSPEDLLLSEVETIDLHHGPYSADPAYTVLKVFGTPLTGRARDALREYGFDDFRPDEAGFTARRPPPGSYCENPSSW